MDLDEQRQANARGGRTRAERMTAQQRSAAMERANVVKDILRDLGRGKPSTNPFLFEYPVRVQR